MTAPTYEPMELPEKLALTLATHGGGIEPLAPSDQEHLRAAYSYTFGLEALVGHPELVIFGLAPVAARGLLDLIVNHLRLGGTLPVGEAFSGLLDGDQLSFLLSIDIDRFADFLPTLDDIYGDQEWRVCQFGCPLRDGSLPWDESWPEQLRSAQPIIGSW